MAENKKRLAVFIDGSNLYFKLKSLEIKNLSRFDFRGLVNWLARDRKIVSTGYYVGVVRAKSNDKKGQKMRQAQINLFNFLGSKQQRIKVHRGYLMKNDDTFHEKGMDVKIATDLLVGAYKNLYDEALIISSDTDLIPAMEKVKQLGKAIEYIGFGHQPALAVQTFATISRLFIKDELKPFIYSDTKNNVITRKQALELIKQKIKNQNLFKHILAVEIVMKKIAEYFNEDVEKWGLAGLLHDIDYEETKDNPELHSKIGSHILKEQGVDDEICNAVLKHNEAHCLIPESKMEKALFVSDPITGLIVATTLVLPSKKLLDVTVENVLNRFKEKSFAKGANRDIIKQCETLLDLSLEKFVEISLKAMQEINGELGL